MSDKKMVLMYSVSTEPIDFMKLIKLLEVGLPQNGRMNFMEVVPATENTKLTKVESDMYAIVTELPNEHGEYRIVFDTIEERDMYLAAQKVLVATEVK